MARYQACSLDEAKRNPGLLCCVQETRIALRAIRAANSPFAARPDLLIIRQRALEFLVEQPHRIENLAVAAGLFGPVSLPEREDAVVAQVRHDPRLGHAVGHDAAGPDRGTGRARNDLDQL